MTDSRVSPTAIVLRRTALKKRLTKWNRSSPPNAACTRHGEQRSFTNFCFATMESRPHRLEAPSKVARGQARYFHWNFLLRGSCAGSDISLQGKCRRRDLTSGATMQTATTTSTKSLTKQINENVTPLVRSVVRCSHQPLRAFIRHRKSLTCPRATLSWRSVGRKG